MHDGLYRACARAGLGTSYHDVWGRHVEVAPARLAELLREFGFGAHEPGDDAGWDAALDRHDDAQWRRGLPPVVLAAVDEPIASFIRLPAQQATVAWQLTDEQGGVHRGAVDLDSAIEHARRAVDGELRVERPWVLDLALPMGYYRLQVEGCAHEALLVVAPPRCYRPGPEDDVSTELERHWGVAVQLYALRSERQWGIGDFGDLAALAKPAARMGAQAIGLNPLHALFPQDPAKRSPYSPSSRLHLNLLYIEVEAVPAFRRCESARRVVASQAFQQRLAALRAAPLIDYVGVAEAKLEVLALLHAEFIAADPRQSLHDPEREAFDAFIAERGDALLRQAVFDALQTYFHALDPAAWGWPAWPQGFDAPDTPQVQQFAAAHAPRVAFFAWLQWVAETQLKAAAARCRAEGMAIGLYLDLAVSVDRFGADAWGARSVLASGVSVGAPPDEFNPLGQDWGLPPMRPAALRESGYRLFIDTLRAGMRHAGALRIDHVMGLTRLFCMPPGATAAEGAYVQYPAEEMLAIVALESRRHRCIVIGEDLGTVADETRRLLARFGLLSYRLLYFERDGGGFKPPSAYPREALAAVSTHDLATLEGWWSSTDLRERVKLDLFPSDALALRQLAERAEARAQLLQALRDQGLLDTEVMAEALGQGELPIQAAAAVHRFLALSPARLMMVQAEDLLGERQQANMPGTVDAHPNWQRRLAVTGDQWPSHPRARHIAEAVTQERPGPDAAHSDAAPRTARIPRATYRLQFHRDFDFDAAIAVLPYLARLGVSHVYCSPIQRARPGSRHGYDVVAHDEINPELGGADGFERFVHAVRAQRMGLLLDLVPNHMGVLGADNPWWMDVLESGERSAFARFFDIEWQPLDAELAGKVLIPVLGDAYGRVLEQGELRLVFSSGGGAFFIGYHAHRFPLAPASYADVLSWAEALVDDVAVQSAFASIGYAFAHLPVDLEDGASRAREKAIAHGRLRDLLAQHPVAKAALQAALDAWNRPRARDALHALLEAQHYRLAFWRVASDEINYRRFFDVNELAALRIELPEVFEATQGLALDLAARGWVDGLRIDHPDGLRDPARYFERLQAGYVRRTGRPPQPDEGDRPARPLYVVAEKIAAPHEEVPDSWCIHGTTGYRFANVANGVLVDTAAARAFERIWRSFTGLDMPYAEVVHQSKRAVTANALAADMTVLASMLLRIARADRRTRDYTLNNLRRALAEVASCLSVYRTYVGEGVSAQDRRFIDEAVDAARKRSELADASVFDFIRGALLGQCEAPGEAQPLVRRFAAHFQQFSAPVAAKGVEDTAFYRYFPLASLNEVGGDPDVFGLTLAQFHAASRDRAARWPHTMLATSTHDNKRAEDVRMRIDVLSEMPAAWRLALRRWRRLQAPLRRRLRATHGLEPSAADEYMLYQTLLGTWAAGEAGVIAPDYADRLVAYMHKAAREAKLRTSWMQSDQAYEAALEGFVRRILDPVHGAAFLADFRPLAARIAWYGGLNSLVLMALKFTSAGVPDVYQGSELIDLSLVDPDNRRAVDYDQRAQRLDALDAMAAAAADAGPDALASQMHALLAPARLDDAKLWTVSRLLRLRAERESLLRDGAHEALAVHGPAAQAVIAYRRVAGDAQLWVVAARFFAKQDNQRAREERDVPDVDLATGWDAAPWAGTKVESPPSGMDWQDVLTGRRRSAGEAWPVDELLRNWPCAVLVACDASRG